MYMCACQCVHMLFICVSVCVFTGWHQPSPPYSGPWWWAGQGSTCMFMYVSVCVFKGYIGMCLSVYMFMYVSVCTLFMYVSVCVFTGRHQLPAPYSGSPRWPGQGSTCCEVVYVCVCLCVIYVCVCLCVIYFLYQSSWVADERVAVFQQNILTILFTFEIN